MKYAVSLMLVWTCVLGEAPAPYPPSGWKPNGPAFDLPGIETSSRFNQTQILLQPQTKYGPPQQPARQYGTPQQSANQYLSPQLPQQQYGTPRSLNQQTITNQQPSRTFENQQEFSNLFPRQQQLPYQYPVPQPFRSPQTQQQHTSRPFQVIPNSASQFNDPVIQITQRQQPLANQYLPNFKVANFLQPNEQINFRNQYNAKQFVFSDTQNNGYDGEYRTIVLTKEEEEEQLNRNYGKVQATTPKTRRATARPRNPEPTTPETISQPAEEDFDENPDRPNVSIATAVANGQYYLLRPDGQLQKVTYKTSQTEEEAKNNKFTANLVYQDVEPIKDPIYNVDGTPLYINNQN